MFKPCMKVLPAAQRQLWRELGPTVALGFVLYGGTAIALRLGHRQSVDFDFFSERPLDRPAIHAAFPFMERCTVLQDERNSLGVLAPADAPGPEQVKLSFFGTIGFGRVGHPDLTDDGVLEVASLDDLMATKVKVILQRAEAKDYRDIVQMIGVGVDLARALAAARVLYGPNFQPSESLKAMAYFQDGDLATLSGSEKNSLVQAVRTIGALPPVVLRSSQLSSASPRQP
jgi:hypothetical protein